MKQRLGHSGIARDVVVTGASAGVGRATARVFGARGDRIGMIASSEAGIARARQDIALGRGIIAIAADVADGDDIEAAAKLWH